MSDTPLPTVMEYTGPVFSPSQTEKYIRCPKLWDYSRRWENHSKDSWFEKLIGNSIHDGLMTYCRVLQGSAVEDPHVVAQAHFASGWPQGEILGDYDKEAGATFVKRGLAKALSLAIKLTEHAKILRAEESLGPEQCQPDLVMEKEGVIEIIDWKYGHSVSPYYLQRRLDEAEASWQLRHYAWRVQTLYPELTVASASIVLTVGIPKCDVKLAPVTITPELLTHWFGSATQWWAEMSACRAGTRFTKAAYGQACAQFGGCPFYDATYRLHGDESRFDTIYAPRTYR